MDYFIKRCHPSFLGVSFWDFLKNLFFIVVQLQLSPFSPCYSPLPNCPPPPTFNPPPGCLYSWVLYACFTTLPLLPLMSSSCSLLVTVSLFFISMSLVPFCLLVCFVDKVPFIGEIIWYLSLTAWLISLSIMLSSSIHAVAKGRSSFFLSAA